MWDRPPIFWIVATIILGPAVLVLLFNGWLLSRPIRLPHVAVRNVGRAWGRLTASGRRQPRHH